jgi:obg-like ATPase 1
MLEQDQPVRDGVWTSAEIELINEKAQFPSPSVSFVTDTQKMSLISTKPTIYLVNLTMKDYLRQKSKYLPPIAAWVTSHGGLPRDIIPFSIEFEEKLYSLRGDPEALKEFLGENKVKSKLEKVITEGIVALSFNLSYLYKACH